MPDRVFLDRRDAGTPPVEHAAQTHGPLTVRLAAGHDAGDERQRPRPGHFDAVDLPGQYPCQAPDPGVSPGNVTAVASQLRFSPPGRRRTWLPGASAPYLGITLSDESEQGERAHSRWLSRGRSHLGARWLGSADQVDRARRHFPLGLGEDRPLCVILVASIPVVPVPCLRGGRVREVWHSGVLSGGGVGWGWPGHRCPGYHGGTAVTGARWSRSGRPARARLVRAGTSG